MNPQPRRLRYDQSGRRERLIAANGLRLTPAIDHLFDRGFYSFRALA